MDGNREISPTLLNEAAGILLGCSRLAVSTGAGVSQESGIPTFRDAQKGLWERFSPEELASVDGYLKNPQNSWLWYADRRKRVVECSPNPGHYALVELEKYVEKVVIITQNVDGLHKRAGSTDVTELHGNITRVRCFNNKSHLIENWKDVDYEGEIPPPCPHCSGTLRPDVVWFGEQLPAAAIERSFSEAERCDVMLVVGTSGTVQPAASLPWITARSGGKVIEINPQESGVTATADIFLQGKSGEILPALLNKIVKLTET